MEAIWTFQKFFFLFRKILDSRGRFLERVHDIVVYFTKNSFLFDIFWATKSIIQHFSVPHQNERNSLSVFGINMRTTSSLESLNATLKRWFPSHPHIYKFLECLKLFEFSKALDMLEAVRTGAPTPEQLQRKKKKDQKREDKIKYLTDLLEYNGFMTAEQFLRLFAADVHDAEEVMQEEGGNTFILFFAELILRKLNLFLILYPLFFR